MRHLLTAACALSCAMVFSSGANAQKAGTYTGTSADGQFLDFTVGTDTNTDSIAVLEAGINFDAACKGAYPDLMQTWGLGFTTDIVKRKAAMLFPGQDIYVVANATFSADGNTMTGTVTTRVVGFAPATGAPNKAEFCESARQAFTATLSSDASKPPTLAPGVSIHYPATK